MSICANKLVPEPQVFPDSPPALGILLVDGTGDGLVGVVPKLKPVDTAAPEPKENFAGPELGADDPPKIEVPCPKGVVPVWSKTRGKTT